MKTVTIQGIEIPLREVSCVCDNKTSMIFSENAWKNQWNNMKLSDLIKKAIDLQEEHGDLEILDEDGFSVFTLSLLVFDRDIDEWNVNAGDKVAQIKSDR